MWLLLVAALAICAVVAIGAALNSGPKPQHARPRHLEAVPDPPEVGSMILAEERALEWLPGPYLQPGWRQRMTAELSPEALAAPPPFAWDYEVPAGPGAGDVDVVSSAPAPDQPSDWLAEQLDVLRAWSEWQQQKAAIL